MKKVTGIRGIFFKCDEPEKMRNWYSENSGLVTDECGSLFEFRIADKKEETNYLQWSPFAQNTKYFEPSKKEFMINYRAENLVDLVNELKLSGVTICDEIEEFEYGNFLHIVDPQGNKIVFWEPVDTGFSKESLGKTIK